MLSRLTPFLILALAAAACDAEVDTVLAENETLVLSAHDSAHVRTLVVEPASGVSIDQTFVPVLLLESGERLEFATARVPTLSDSMAMLPSLRVNLTPPVVGTLRLRVCTERATAADSTAAADAVAPSSECRTVSMRVQTRGRTLRGRSS